MQDDSSSDLSSDESWERFKKSVYKQSEEIRDLWYEVSFTAHPHPRHVPIVVVDAPKPEPAVERILDGAHARIKTSSSCSAVVLECCP